MNISGLVGARWRNIYLTSQLSNPNKESSAVGEPTLSIKNWTEKRESEVGSKMSLVGSESIEV